MVLVWLCFGGSKNHLTTEKHSYIISQQGVEMDNAQFTEQIKILLDEYRSLSRSLATAQDPDAVKQQMHDNVRRQNALRQQVKTQGE
jgi:hypothetical protein